LSSVTVWLNEPLFVQQMVVPGATVKSAGENEYSVMLTWVSPASQVPVGFAEAPPNPGSTPKKTAASAATNASNPSGSPLLIPTAPTITISTRSSKSGAGNVRCDA